MFDLILDHNEACKIVDNEGFEGFTRKMEDKYNYKFFSCSTHWKENKKYICKLKGSLGDLVIGWKE